MFDSFSERPNKAELKIVKSSLLSVDTKSSCQAKNFSFTSEKVNDTNSNETVIAQIVRYQLQAA